MRTLKEFDVKNKKVLVRCDFDVPLSKEGGISDVFRIKQSISTIDYLVKEGAKVILISHLGRPKGTTVDSLRMNPVAKELSELLARPVVKLDDCVGPEVENAVNAMKAGEVILLENVRFHKEEEENDSNFAGQLAKLGDLYVNNAFADSHRDHASITGINKYLPSAAGFTLATEIKVLSGLINDPKKPLVVIIGGAKVEETKLKVIDRFSDLAQAFLLGGLVAKEIKDKNVKLRNPEKIVWPKDETGGGKDIGPETMRSFKDKISLAKTVFWNGPLGLIEEEEFSLGSKQIAEDIIESKAFSVVGGGDTVGFINRLGLAEKFGYVSTGGGAMMEFLAGEELPGIKALG